MPLFNLDQEAQLPDAVAAFCNMVNKADALLIASPEYAHGVSGVMKNALDWLVGCEGFYGKPVAVVNTSARAQHADLALRETLQTMSAVILESASLTIPLLGANLDENGIVTTAEIAGAIQALLTALSAQLCRLGDMTTTCSNKED